MVIYDAATFPGVVLACRVIGIQQIEQKSEGKAERKHRLFAVPRQPQSSRLYAISAICLNRSGKSLKSS
jgi:inorganic pyrophosphatase